MVDTARRFPFLFLLPSLIAGIMAGELFPNHISVWIYLFASAFVIIIKFTKPYNFQIIEFTTPFYIFFIGILAYSINIAELFELDSLPSNITPFSNLKDYLINKNKLNISNPTICALSNAICLGDKSGLTNEVKNLFAKCGIMHIVAVSGLHVGAIYIMARKVLQLLRIRIIQSKVIAIIFIWIYAIIIGMPPSVLRAASILTYVITGELCNKSFSSLNGILACAFFTLIIAPNNINNLSFQLSYAAYIGIILIFPIFAPAKKGGNKYAKKIIASISVSVAAQLLTTPIAIYYFHGTSINSFILNILVIPLTSLLLYCDFFTLIVPSPISQLLGKCVEILGNSIIYITKLIEPINIYIDNIFMSEVSIIIYYILTFTIFTIIPKYINKF